MPSQNNPGRQFDKQHAVTIVATVALEANRFVAYDGGYATKVLGGGAKDMQGVSEHAAAVGEAVSAITGYSALVEANEAIAFGAWIKPDLAGTGKAAVGSATEYCARALGAASAAGQLVECQLLPHVQPTI